MNSNIKILKVQISKLFVKQKYNIENFVYTYEKLTDKFKKEVINRLKYQWTSLIY